MDEHILDNRNPTRMRYVIIAIVMIWIGIPTLSFILNVWENGITLIAEIMAVIGGIIGIIIFYYSWPNIIEIKTSGILIKYRTSTSDLFIAWNKIVDIQLKTKYGSGILFYLNDNNSKNGIAVICQENLRKLKAMWEKEKRHPHSMG